MKNSRGNSRNVKWRHIQLCQFRGTERGKCLENRVWGGVSCCVGAWAWAGGFGVPRELAAEHRAHFIKRSVNKVKRETAATTAATMVIPMAHAILTGILSTSMPPKSAPSWFSAPGVQQNIIPKQIWMSNVTEMQMKKKQKIIKKKEGEEPVGFRNRKFCNSKK